MGDLRRPRRLLLTRGDVSECREAVLTEEVAMRREVYSLFQSKYRIPLYGSRFLGFLFGSNPDPAEAEREGVLFRLDQCATATDS